MSTPAMTKEEKAEQKLQKEAEKEGGKKGQDLEGMCDMGGCSFFHVALDSAEGRHDLVALAMKGANKDVDPEGEDRKGGAGHIGKCFMSAADEILVAHIHVPEQQKEKCNIKDWAACIMKTLGKTSVITEEDEYMIKIEMKANPEENLFPLKIRDQAINDGFAFLVEKGLVAEGSDSTDECYLPEDW